jgi:hypothetical protein
LLRWRSPPQQRVLRRRRVSSPAPSRDRPVMHWATCRSSARLPPCLQFSLAPTTRSGVGWDMTRGGRRWGITRGGMVLVMTRGGMVFSIDAVCRLSLCPPTGTWPLRSPPRPGRVGVACAQHIPRRIARHSTGATNSARLEYVDSTSRTSEIAYTPTISAQCRMSNLDEM